MKGRRGRELVEDDENDGSLMAAIDEDSVEPTEIEPPVDCNARAMVVVLSV